MAISGIGVAYTLGGFVLVYSGWANRSITDTVKGFLSGKPPAANPSGPIRLGVNDNSSGSGSGSGSVPATDSAIANDALKYVGHRYVYGGAPGPNGTSGWDCSSMVNWVLGHDLGMTLPGDSSPGYNGESHGPTTLSYLAWSGAKTISNRSSAAQAGDLCVWQTHIGIAIGNGQMVSALNESLGTKVTTISGGAPGGELLFVRRVKTTESPATGGIYPTPSGQSTTLPGL